jgi:hypothetical protein
MPGDSEIEFIDHTPKSLRREDKHGLVSIIYYSSHIPPSRHVGCPGDLYVLLQPYTLFWKEERWRPWIWMSAVTHPLSQDHLLNFDFKGPVWTYNSRAFVESSFIALEHAIDYFFDNVVETSFELGSESKPILID